jgi:RHS repeat-associated protein
VRIVEKFFEWSNRLVNVLATVSDRKIAHSSNSSAIDYYTADVISAQDYYPFGMIMPGRVTSNQYGYRYGFNGKEMDKETSSTTTYDYGFRIYSPALGRFLSVDPLTKGYPMLTPYQFASNSPIAGIDLDGLEFFYAADGSYLGHLGKSGQIIVVNDLSLKESTKSLIKNWGGENSKYGFDPTGLKYSDGAKPYDNFSAASADAKNKVIRTIYDDNIKGKVANVVIGKLDRYVLGETSSNTTITIDETKTGINGSREVLFNNQYNLVNTLYHENLHANDKYESMGPIFEHVQIFIDETKHSSWKNTTADYKEAILNSAFDKAERTGYINSATSMIGGLGSLVNHDSNRKSVFKSKNAEAAFNYYYNIYSTAVEQYNKNTSGEKIPLKTKADLTKTFTPPKK